MNEAADDRWDGWLDSPEATQALGRAIGEHCRPGDLIALRGELGAGKTQLVRGLALGLGIDPRQVSSPTFVLAQEYERETTTGGSEERPAVLVHVDAYRLGGRGDAASMGLDDLIEQQDIDAARQAVVAVEWADRVADLEAASVLVVSLTHAGEGKRRVEISARGGWRPRFAAVAAVLAKLPEAPRAGKRVRRMS